MTTQDILELAARCEAATGPDRDIDREIAPLVGLRIVDEGQPIGRVCYDQNNHGVPLPSFTASLDAAMALVPAGWRLQHGLTQFNQGTWHCSMRSPIVPDLGDGRQGRNYAASKTPCATPALALTAASLKARAHTKGEE